jgi:rhodanese-related sulfurtransferase
LIRELEPRELDAWLHDDQREQPLIVDVRESWEFDLCRIEPSLLVPLAALPAAVATLPLDRDLVVVCHRGVRSLHAAAWLMSAGFGRVQHLRGGIAAWGDEVDAQMKRY